MDIEQVKFGGLNFTAIHTPGHTVGHVSYLLDGQALGAPDCLFSGDHLFLGGCGKFVYFCVILTLILLETKVISL